jgi:uncharacterized peroxidase-related enzyme
MVIAQETGVPFLEENEAVGEVAELYDEIKSVLQSPFVPNIMKAIAVSAPALKIYWLLFKNATAYLTLPESLVSMISYTVAQNNNCRYCSTNYELSCRVLGIDEQTLAALVEDLGNVTPERVRAIIEFAVMVARHPQGLVAADYDALRQYGITDAEIVEIILIAAATSFGNIISDALKVPVEQEVISALSG